MTSQQSSLACNVTNPSTKMTARTTFQANQCSVQPSLNGSSFTLSGFCCVPSEFVRTRLIPPVTCPKSDDLKENCNCRNISINAVNSVVTCNCTHPQGNSNASDLLFNGVNNACDCDNINFGDKNCRCCVSADLQLQQLQPVCRPGQSLETCSCPVVNKTVNRNSCSCTRSNGMLFTNLNLNSSASYCSPLNTTDFRPCNVCVSTTALQTARPVCDSGRQATECQCAPVTVQNRSSLSCNCTNKYFYNTVTSNIAFNLNQCALYGNNTAHCCANIADLTQKPVCSSSQVLVQGQRCSNITTSERVQVNCTFNGQHFLNNSVSVQSNRQAPDFTQCGCSVEQNVTSCQCCVNQTQWQTASPVCDANSQSSERCQCGFIPVITNRNVTLFRMENQTETYYVNTTVNVTNSTTGKNQTVIVSQPMNRTVLKNVSYWEIRSDVTG